MSIRIDESKLSEKIEPWSLSAMMPVSSMYFAILKKTCRKLGISFWQYLKDQIMNISVYPSLPLLIEQEALKSG